MSVRLRTSLFWASSLVLSPEAEDLAELFSLKKKKSLKYLAHTAFQPEIGAHANNSF